VNVFFSLGYLVFIYAQKGAKCHPETGFFIALTHRGHGKDLSTVNLAFGK
jgi:hypothetical protein